MNDAGASVTCGGVALPRLPGTQWRFSGFQSRRLGKRTIFRGIRSLRRSSQISRLATRDDTLGLVTSGSERRQIACQLGGRCLRICPTERSKISLLEDNSLEIGTGDFIGKTGNLSEASREFA